MALQPHAICPTKTPVAVKSGHGFCTPRPRVGFGTWWWHQRQALGGWRVLPGGRALPVWPWCGLVLGPQGGCWPKGHLGHWKPGAAPHLCNRWHHAAFGGLGPWVAQVQVPNTPSNCPINCKHSWAVYRLRCILLYSHYLTLRI